MKYYVSDYNGILTDLKQRLVGHLTNPREADVWIVWQDCRGSYKDLIEISKRCYPKPVYVVQHGAGATRDYGPPNSLPMIADKFLCWGKSDYDRLVSLGYADRSVIVGCPLNLRIKPKNPHDEKVILFIPVNTGKEEPENIAVYYELLKYKYEQAQIVALMNRTSLKDKWGFNGKTKVSFNELAVNADVVAKLLPWHDKSLYHGQTIVGTQCDPSNNEKVFQLLRNVDLVVGLDEGTTEVFAYGHNVPVVVVDEFKYRQHGNDGRSFSVVDINRTKGAVHTDLLHLHDVVSFALAHPEDHEIERREVAEEELGLSYGDPVANILKVIKHDATKNFSFIR